MIGNVYVLRHGETAWSRDRKHTGRSDIPLTDHGRLQAGAAGERLRELRGGAPWATVLTSPLRRAAETVQLAGYDAKSDDRLQEWDYGQYDGVTTDEIRVANPKWNLWRDGCPGGESAAEVGARVDALFAEVVEPARPDGDVLLVAHSHLLRVLTARWLALPAEAGRLFVLDPAGIGILGVEHGGPALYGWNLSSD